MLEQIQLAEEQGPETKNFSECLTKLLEGPGTIMKNLNFETQYRTRSVIVFEDEQYFTP